MLDRLLAAVVAAEDVWIATVREVADHHRVAAPEWNPMQAMIPASFLSHPAWKGV